MRRFLLWILGIGVLGAGVGWFLTGPQALSAAEWSEIDQADADAARGEMVFWAAGCASCHTAPEAEASDQPLLAGGQVFKTAFGTFYAPNVSPSTEAGIGDWTLQEFATAVKKGVSPGGGHYYPAFPYTAYARMTGEDIKALFTFMTTLPADATLSKPHEVGFPFNIRRSVGGWKLLFGSEDWAVAEASTPELERGRYLVEALAHCGECHTPRNALGGMQMADWLKGGPNPNGEGRIPGITPAQLDWSSNDIAYYLTTGFTPDFDSAGGHMTEVVKNMARLPEADVAAIVAYLKALP